MARKKPFRRTCRQGYLLHQKFANDPQHYVRAFRILVEDIDELFNFIEPADMNLCTYSHRIQQLLMRTCVEVEANLTAILKENSYSRTSDLTMKDYKLVNQSHRLSSYEVRITTWTGNKGIRIPLCGLDRWPRFPGIRPITSRNTIGMTISN